MVKRRMAVRKCKFKWKQLYQVQRWLASWGNGQICILMNNLRCGNHAVRGRRAFSGTLEFPPLGFSGLKFDEAENPKGANSRELKGRPFCSKDILKGVVPWGHSFRVLFRFWCNPKAHFRWVSRSRFLGINLVSFESNWMCELDSALDSSFCLGLRIMSSILSPISWSKPICFPSKMVPCRFRLNLPLVGLGTSSWGYASNLWFSANRVALFHWTLDLKWP